jgi:hypothetical protein
MTSPDPWTNEPDRPQPHRFRRIYDANGVSVARVYDPVDAQLIAMAPQMRDFIRRYARGETPSIMTARSLFREAGGGEP